MMLGHILNTPIADSNTVMEIISDAGASWSSGFGAGSGLGWSIGGNLSAVVGVPAFSYGDFVEAALDYMSGVGRPTDEFYNPPLDVEYDLSVDTVGESATFTLYDRWHGVKDVYTFSNSSFAQFQVPLDNSDFSTGGQYSGRDAFGSYEVF